jgi:hypothetical protein
MSLFAKGKVLFLRGVNLDRKKYNVNWGSVQKPRNCLTRFVGYRFRV